MRLLITGSPTKFRTTATQYMHHKLRRASVEHLLAGIPITPRGSQIGEMADGPRALQVAVIHLTCHDRAVFAGVPSILLPNITARMLVAHELLLDPRTTMSRRFFVDSPIKAETAVLTGQEAQHLSKVMRAKVGDELILFDGSGVEFPARVQQIGRSTVELAVIERREVDRELSFRLVIGVALPKGDRQRWLVEKLAELGVTTVVPLVTARGVAQPSGNALQRLRRAIVEASKQCGRNRLMAVREATTLEAFLMEPSDGRTKLIAHPRTAAVSSVCSTAADDVAVAIGPEGGFTDEEVSRAGACGWHCISLGARLLRTETAAVAIAASITLQDRSQA